MNDLRPGVAFLTTSGIDYGSVGLSGVGRTGRCMHNIALHNNGIYEINPSNPFQQNRELSSTGYLGYNMLSTNSPIPWNLIQPSLDARAEMRRWITGVRALEDQIREQKLPVQVFFLEWKNPHITYANSRTVGLRCSRTELRRVAASWTKSTVDTCVTGRALRQVSIPSQDL